MQTLFIILFLLIGHIDSGWLTDMETAKKKAKETEKPILLVFSGSDWCVHCIKTKKDIFDKHVFSEYAEKNLVLLNADFPRLKKHKLDQKQEEQNKALAAKYNPKGQLPYIVLLDSNEKVIKEWAGSPNLSPEEFVEQLKKCH